MERKELKDLGLDDKAIESVLKLYNAGLAPIKQQLEDANNQNETLQGSVKDRDSQIASLKKNNKDNSELQTQIEKLQSENKQKDKDFQAQLNETKVNGAIKLALQSSGGKDVDMLMSKIDKDTIKLEDGKLKGLDEQVKDLQKSHSYMFSDADNDNSSSGSQGGNGGNGTRVQAFQGGNPSGGNPGDQNDFVSKINERLNQK